MAGPAQQGIYNASAGDTKTSVLEMLKGKVPQINPEEPLLLRPDVNITTMGLFSIFGGFLGFDHMYARSPMTGVLKLLTGGGLGMWWAWDVIQLWFERERVELYGLTGFLNGGSLLGKAVGQGMITSQPSVYKTEAPFSLWMIGVFFSFMGIDALIARNVGQFLRKLLEFIVFALCLSALINYRTTGFFALLIAVIGCSLLGSAIIMEYISIMSVVIRGSLLSEGVHYTTKEKQHYNSVLNKLTDMLPSRWYTDNQKQQIKENLAYLGLPVKTIRKMLTIFHPSEMPPPSDKEPVDDPSNITTVISFLIYMISPILICGQLIWDLFYSIFKSIEYLINPTAAARDAALKIAEKVAVEMAKKASEKLDEKGFGGMAGAITGGKNGMVGLSRGKNRLAGLVTAAAESPLATAATAATAAAEEPNRVATPTGLGGIIQAKSFAADAARASISDRQAAEVNDETSVKVKNDLADREEEERRRVQNQKLSANVMSYITKTGQDAQVEKNVQGVIRNANEVAAKQQEPQPQPQPPQIRQRSVRRSFAPTKPANPISIGEFAPTQVQQRGGAFAEPLSTEAQVFGAVTVALISGGVIKGLVDYLIAE